MKTPESVVPVFWFRVAVASQLFLEAGAGFLLFGLLRDVARAMEPEKAAAVEGVFSLVEGAYFCGWTLLMAYCCVMAKPPTEENFTKTRWWALWAELHRPEPSRGRTAGAGSASSAHHVGSAPDFNPVTGLPMVDSTNTIDVGGNVYGTHSSSSDMSDFTGSGLH